jgi:hypothetical protein
MSSYLSLRNKLIWKRFNSIYLKIKTLTKSQKLDAGCRWLTPVILATQEAEIRRIKV